MTPDGRFRSPPRVPVTTRIIMGAVVVAVLSGVVAFAAFALWIALTLVPVILTAVLVAVAVFRFKAWQARRSFGRNRDLRPWDPRRG